MIFFKRFLSNRVFICYLTIAFLTLSFASSASGMFIPSTQREADLQEIQKVLELKLVQHKLSRLGLSKQEIETRLKQLDDEQIHQIAAQIRTLEAGAGEKTKRIILVIILAVVIVALIVAFIAHIYSNPSGVFW